MSKKIYDPFSKMSKKQLEQMGELESFSRNLKKKKKKEKEKEKKHSKVA